MGTALIYLVVMILVAAVIYLLASAVFGRGEELAPLPPGASPTRLPSGEVTGEDIRTVRFQPVLRGYKMSEVDWVMARLSTELDELRARLAELEPDHPGELRNTDDRTIDERTIGEHDPAEHDAAERMTAGE